MPTNTFLSLPALSVLQTRVGVRAHLLFHRPYLTLPLRTLEMCVIKTLEWLRSREILVRSLNLYACVHYVYYVVSFTVKIYHPRDLIRGNILIIYENYFKKNLPKFCFWKYISFDFIVEWISLWLKCRFYLTLILYKCVHYKEICWVFVGEIYNTIIRSGYFWNL